MMDAAQGRRSVGRWLGVGACVVLGALWAVPGAGAQGLSLHVISTAAPEGLPSPDADSWSVELSVTDGSKAMAFLPQSLDVVLGVAPGASAEADSETPQWDTVRVDVGRELAAGGAVEPWHRQASFVVDFHESPVVEITEQFLETLTAEELSRRPELETLSGLVHRHITHKNPSRGWDFASRVAQKRTGDCSEHAVLLTALARSFGYPARVVLGLLMTVPADGAATAPDARVDVEDDGADATSATEDVTTEDVTTMDVAAVGPGAYGHAWSEIYDGQAWRVVDATLVQELEDDTPTVSTRHLPLMILDNEGPGYGKVLAALHHVFPKHVDVRPGPGANAP